MRGSDFAPHFLLLSPYSTSIPVTIPTPRRIITRGMLTAERRSVFRKSGAWSADQPAILPILLSVS